MMLNDFLFRLRSLFRPKTVEQELEEEISCHLERQIESYMRSGLSQTEAERRAKMTFGGREQVKEECRDSRGISLIETTAQDLRYTLRTLRKSPMFTIVAAGTLALAIGANTAIFTSVYAVLIQPLPFKDPARLMMLWTTEMKRDLLETPSSYPNYADWKSQSNTFEDMAYFMPHTSTVSAGGNPEKLKEGFVSANFFSVMGVPALLGRTFSTEDLLRDDHLVVLSQSLWRRWYAASPDVIGKTLMITSWRGMPQRVSRIIGVMPTGFEDFGGDHQFWEPVSVVRWDRTLRGRNMALRVIGRLKPRPTWAQAQSEMDLIARRLRQAYPDSNSDLGVSVVPLHQQITGNMRRPLTLLFGAVALVLLIACSNVANLLLTRGAVREREVALRIALGAGRSRLVRQLLTENLVLSFFAGLLGLALGIWANRGIVALAPVDVPRLGEAGLNVWVMLFALGLSSFSSILFGSVPAWKVSHGHPNDVLKAGARNLSQAESGRGRAILVVAEFALALILLTGAGLFVRSFLVVQSLHPGFQADRALIMHVAPQLTATDDERLQFWKEVVERVRALGGVQAVGAVTQFFLDEREERAITVEGQPQLASGQIQISKDGVLGDYFRAVGVPLLRGRLFTDTDRAGSPRVIVINETLARRFFPGADPIGKRVKWGDERSWCTIVGVVGDMRRQGLERNPIAQPFIPFAQRSESSMDIVVRTASDPLRLASAVREVVRSVDKTAIVGNATTLAVRLQEFESQRRFETLLLGLFSAIALLLAAIGIYGMMHYSVVQRTHEIGVRMALGAHPGNVLRMVIGRGVSLAVIGLGVGLSGAWWLTRLVSNQLYGVKASDPVTFVVVSILLLTVAALASLIPAWRATKLDPTLALRFE